MKFDPYLIQKARILKDLGRLEKARDVLLEHLVDEPDDSVTLHELGNVYFHLDEWDKAQESYEAALALDPDADGTLLQLGVLTFTLGRLEQAEKYLRASFRCHPSPDARYWLFRLCSNLADRQDEALEHLKAGLELAPDDLECQFALLQSNLDMDQQELPSELYSQARKLVEQYPENKVLRTFLGRLTTRKDPGQAEEIFSDLVQEFPEDRQLRVELLRAACSGLRPPSWALKTYTTLMSLPGVFFFGLWFVPALLIGPWRDGYTGLSSVVILSLIGFLWVGLYPSRALLACFWSEHRKFMDDTERRLAAWLSFVFLFWIVAPLLVLVAAPTAKALALAAFFAYTLALFSIPMVDDSLKSEHWVFPELGSKGQEQWERRVGRSPSAETQFINSYCNGLALFEYYVLNLLCTPLTVGVLVMLNPRPEGAGKLESGELVLMLALMMVPSIIFDLRYRFVRLAKASSKKEAFFASNFGGQILWMPVWLVASLTPLVGLMAK